MRSDKPTVAMVIYFVLTGIVLCLAVFSCRRNRDSDVVFRQGIEVIEPAKTEYLSTFMDTMLPNTRIEVQKWLEGHYITSPDSSLANALAVQQLLKNDKGLIESMAPFTIGAYMWPRTEAKDNQKDEWAFSLFTLDPDRTVYRVVVMTTRDNVPVISKFEILQAYAHVKGKSIPARGECMTLQIGLWVSFANEPAGSIPALGKVQMSVEEPIQVEKWPGNGDERSAMTLPISCRDKGLYAAVEDRRGYVSNFVEVTRCKSYPW